MLNFIRKNVLISVSRSFSVSSKQQNNIMDLKKVVSQLQSFAPTSLAESWDNVGLLIEPSENKMIKVIMMMMRVLLILTEHH